MLYLEWCGELWVGLCVIVGCGSWTVCFNVHCRVQCFFRDWMWDAVIHLIVGWRFGVCGDVWTGVYLGVSLMVSCFVRWCALKCGARWCGF